MKRIATILLTLIAVLSVCKAQDTVQYMDPRYHFNERNNYVMLHNSPFDTTLYPGATFFSGFTWNDICCHSYQLGGALSRYHTPSPQEPMTIYGVAVTVDTTYQSLDKHPFVAFLATGRGDSSIELLDSADWSDVDQQGLSYFKYSVTGDGVVYEKVVPSYEIYFDSPIVVYDTFYVGVRDGHTPSPLPTNLFINASADSCSSHWIKGGIDSPYTYYSDSPFAHYSSYWGGVFPILRPNTFCMAPGIPKAVVYVSTATVRFELPYEEGDSLQLSVARVGQPADSGTVYDISDSIFSVVLTDTGHYTAQLRRYCRRYEDMVVPSQWGTPVYFFLPTIQSIAAGPMETVRLAVEPNPASGRVRLRCDEPMLHAEVVDMTGRVVAKYDVGDTKCEFDVSGLPMGVYTVRVATVSGDATRRLIVGNE